MSRTLNYTVQRVLEKLNLDPINSINDTEDAILVAREAESTFFDLLSRNTWPNQEKLIKVQSVSNTQNPTALILGEMVDQIESIRYNVTEDNSDQTVYRRMIWLEPDDFLQMVHSRNTENDNVDVALMDGIELFVYNDKMPEYYTSFDNKYLILDSYDKSVSSTLLGSKTICYGSVIPVWSVTDEYIIPVNERFYPLFLSALTSACSVMLLNTQNPEEERRQMRAISRLRQEAYRTEAESFPRFKYGRKGSGLA